MTSFQTPKLTISGVPVMEQHFVWKKTPGTFPYITTIFVPKGDLNEQIRGLYNPVTIELVCTGGLNLATEEAKIKIENVYLLQEYEADNYTSAWQIADSRWAWRGKILTCSYNKTRLKNSSTGVVPEVITDPAQFRAQYDRFKEGRYLPWSVKGDGSTYTVGEILDIELSKAANTGNLLYKPNDDITKGAGGYILENVEYEGESLDAAIMDLLTQSRLSLSVDLQGFAYLYSIDFLDDRQASTQSFIQDFVAQGQTMPRTGPGILYKNDLKRVRPQYINVLFEKKFEVRVVGSDPLPRNEKREKVLTAIPNVFTEQNISDRFVITAENVIPVMRATFSEINQKTWQPGEYAPMQEFLSEINLVDGNPNTIYRTGTADKYVRDLWFSGQMEQQFAQRLAVQTGGFLEQNYIYAYTLTQLVRQHYRQTYQISPIYLDQMLYWEAQRAAVVDNFSHYSPPSPLWANCCIVPMSKTPSVIKGTAAWRVMAYNLEIKKNDPLRATYTPGTIGVVNEQLGIFRVNYAQDINLRVAQIIPSSVDRLPSVSPADIDKTWETANLSQEHTMETLITVVWAAKSGSEDAFNFRNKYFSVPVNFGGIDPTSSFVFTYISKLESARYSARTNFNAVSALGVGFSAIVGGAIGAVPATGDKPDNIDILQTIANAEATKINFRFKDRLVGKVVLAGFHDIDLFAHLKASEISFGRDGLETTLSFADYPIQPQLEQILPQNTLNFLKRQIPRGGEFSRINK